MIQIRQAKTRIETDFFDWQKFKLLLPFQGENDIIFIYFMVLCAMLFAFGAFSPFFLRALRKPSRTLRLKK
ncbi:hypothetical protein [Flavobacterium sp. UGB4466]|uniref:hypothetical protein n=1 Tax=Flavobacterium sp. UGB4466 TaxID=2730889 RepID=UPI00192B8BDF|nr:hypothetical protein [Flavobacterium sp. UGB4466]